MAPDPTLAIVTLAPGESEVSGIAKWLRRNPNQNLLWPKPKSCLSRHSADASWTVYLTGLMHRGI
jgi:hypothetical protein